MLCAIRWTNLTWKKCACGQFQNFWAPAGESLSPWIPPSPHPPHPGYHPLPATIKEPWGSPSLGWSQTIICFSLYAFWKNRKHYIPSVYWYYLKQNKIKRFVYFCCFFQGVQRKESVHPLHGSLAGGWPLARPGRQVSHPHCLQHNIKDKMLALIFGETEIEQKLVVGG